MKLLIHKTPFYDESIKGYIARVSTDNGYRSTSWIYLKAGLTMENSNTHIVNINKISPSNISLKNLGQLIGLSESELWNLTFFPLYGDFNKPAYNKTIIDFIRKRALNNFETKFCPKCLVEENYFRKLWELRIYTVCHIHSCILINYCPNCNKQVTLSETPIGQCICGFQFEQSEPTFVSNIYVELEKAIAEKVFGYRKNEIANNYLVEKSLYIFTYLIQYLSNFLKKTTKGNLEINTPSYLRNFKAFKAFNNWPVQFYKFLDEYSNSYNKSESYGLQNEFGNLYIVILNKFKDIGEDLKFIVSEYENYLLKEWDGVVRLSGTNTKELFEKSDFLSFFKTTKDLGCRPEVINKLIDSGILKSKKLPSGQLVVYKDSVAKYKGNLTNVITYQKAIDILNIDRRLLENLVEGGIIETSSSLRYKSRRIQYKSVDLLLTNLNSRVKNKKVNGNIINFSKAVKLFGQSGKNPANLVNCVLEGKLEPIQYGNEELIGLKKYHFLESEVRNELKIKNGYTVSDIADMFKGNKNNVYDWINKGLLKGEKDNRKMIFNEEDVQLFSQTYIFLDEIGLLMDKGPREVMSLLTLNEIMPVSGKGIDGAKKYVYLREDISSFISFMESISKIGPSDEGEIYNFDRLVKILNTKEEVLNGWLKKGYLSGKKYKQDIWVTKSELLTFNQKYLMLKEISERMNLDVRVIRKTLADNSIMPISGPEIDAIRKYLYLRKDVEPFIKLIKV